MSDRVQPFGGAHTRRKLDVVAKYLAAYVTVMKKQDFRLYYVDGFAGSGASASKAELSRTENPALFMAECPQHHFQILTKRPDRMAAMIHSGQISVLQNAWLGTSVESEEVANRVGRLATIKGATLFVSFEPLISRIGELDLHEVHWAIVGGESGPKARPMEAEWVERLHEICVRDDVAFFFKQWGGQNKKAAGRELHGRTYDEYPLELEA